MVVVSGVYGVTKLMPDIWFNHLSSVQPGQGLVAYLWNAGEDRFQWAGDLGRHLGIGTQDYPVSNAHFHSLINPRHVPHRLAIFHDALSRGRGGIDISPFSAHYKMRRSDGTQVDVEETAILHVEPGTGMKVVYGLLKIGGSRSTNAPFADSPAAVTQGRETVRQHLEAWADADADITGCLLAVGLDRISLINEAFGTRYADEVIEKAGERLRRIAGENAQTVRLEGDVFCLLFGLSSHSEMATIAQHIVNSFHDAPLSTSRGPAAVSVSIGGVTMNKNSCRDIPGLVARAELAMQSAKEKGRSRFVPYHEAADQAVGQKMLLECGEEFLQALRDNRVRLAFQPVMSSHDHVVSFHESLVRILDADGYVQSAGDFMPALEKLGLSRLVDQHTLRMAIHELELFPDLVLSVNVSNLTLESHDWLRRLVAMLRDRPSIARRLIVEITETAAMHDVTMASRVLKTLKELGCRVALDDFGAGFTAFSQLRLLDIDIVKIDKSFIRNMSESQNHLFVRTLQSLASGIEIETVGEGAETMADARRLAVEGIDHVQGYAFGYPLIERVWLPRGHKFRIIPLLEKNPYPFSDPAEDYELPDEGFPAWAVI